MIELIFYREKEVTKYAANIGYSLHRNFSEIISDSQHLNFCPRMYFNFEISLFHLPFSHFYIISNNFVRKQDMLYDTERIFSV